MTIKAFAGHSTQFSSSQSNDMKRILTIDGGGIKGAFPASFLATIEDILDDRVSRYFDLIVGTSTGGIIALGLGLGFTASEILRFYEQLGMSVFKGNRLWRYIRHLGISKYNQQPLKKALENIFGNKKLGESKNRLVIPSLNLDTGEIHIYKTAHHPKFEIDYKEKVTDVALATSAAPTYFPTHRSAAGIPLIDGGMWANNPTGIAVVEAIGVLNWPRDALRILSLGCTVTPPNVNWGRKLPLGLGYWGMKTVEVFMSGQSSASLGTAKLLAGHENIFRVCPYVPRGRFSLDSTKEILSLKGLGISEARKNYENIKFFFSQPAETFTPYKQVA